MQIRPSLFAGLLLLALVPVGAYAAGQAGIAVVAAVNVALITGSLYHIFSSSVEATAPAAE